MHRGREPGQDEPADVLLVDHVIPGHHPAGKLHLQLRAVVKQRPYCPRIASRPSTSTLPSKSLTFRTKQDEASDEASRLARLSNSDDLERFVFLLGGSDGEPLIGP